jgi:hypothetical protein
LVRAQSAVAPTSQIQSEKQAALNTGSRRNLTEAFSFGDCDKSQFAQPLTKACRRVERHARTGIAHALAAVTAAIGRPSTAAGRSASKSQVLHHNPEGDRDARREQGSRKGQGHLILPSHLCLKRGLFP